MFLGDIYEKIRESDFLLSDEKCTHHLVGVKYIEKVMSAPEVTLICARHEMSTAKQIAFSLGKKIFADTYLSTLVFRNYNIHQHIRPEDYNVFAIAYGNFYDSQNI